MTASLHGDGDEALQMHLQHSGSPEYVIFSLRDKALE